MRSDICATLSASCSRTGHRQRAQQGRESTRRTYLQTAHRRLGDPKRIHGLRGDERALERLLHLDDLEVLRARDTHRGHVRRARRARALDALDHDHLLVHERVELQTLDLERVPRRAVRRVHHHNDVRGERPAERDRVPVRVFERPQRVEALHDGVPLADQPFPRAIQVDRHAFYARLARDEEEPREDRDTDFCHALDK